MNENLLADLIRALTEHGFSEVPGVAEAMTDVRLLLKRQTWNTNRAIVILSPDHLTADLRGYLKRVRKQIAFKCGFFPVFWSIGIQVIIVSTGAANENFNPAKHVSRVDNQWAIIQSLFLIDPATGTYRAGNTWVQLVTGKFQSAISTVLSRYYRLLAG